MTYRDFYTLLLEFGAEPNQKDFLLTRDQLVEGLVSRGYTPKTAAHHASLSRDDGLASNLFSDGLIKIVRAKVWKVPCIEKLKEEKYQKNKPISRYTAGIPPKGIEWEQFLNINDELNDKLVWVCYRKQFSPDRYSIKVIASGARVNGIANYCLVDRSGMLVQNEHAILLQEKHPGVFQKLNNYLQELHYAGRH